MGDAIEANRVAERLDDVILADHVLESLRAVSASDDRVSTGRARRRLLGSSPCAPGHEARSVVLGEVGPIAGAGESRGGSPEHMKTVLMAAAFPP